MSNNENHKKMFTILQAAIADKKLLMAVMFQAMRDNPGAIAGAFDKVVASRRTTVQFPGKIPAGMEIAPITHKCKDCGHWFTEIGIAGACIKCDPDGFDVPY